MTTALEIAIAVVVSLAALSASTSILLDDSATAPPYALGACPAEAGTAVLCGAPARSRGQA